MRGAWLGGAALALCGAWPALAEDTVLTGPAPTWAKPAPPLDIKALPQRSNVVPRFDEQVRVEGNTVTAFFDTATLVSSPEQLAKLGTFSIGWQPAHGAVTVHNLEIMRGDKVIDVLQGGAGFTVLRREAGLEQQIVDGQLTAVKHIEGLQIGDVLRMAVSVSDRDDVLGGNVQDAMILLPAPVQAGFGRARLVWQRNRPLNWKGLMPGITATPKPIDGQWTELEIPLPTPKLPEMPKNMPSRFTPLPLVQFSSFADWNAVAKVMAPRYEVKGAIAPGSELAARIDAIAARSNDPLRRMADALQMVQDEVRYQLMALGNGNYVPQTPADTWAKRYGDCKAKTVLLLAVLDRLGIAAEPVLANSQRGDAVAQTLPSAAAFDHVFVRAKVAGEDFWLDGTMLGSRLADIRDVPRFGYVLPLFAEKAELLALPNRANARPAVDVYIAYDMTGGPHLPAPYRMTVRYSGPSAERYRVAEGVGFDSRLEDFAEKSAKQWTDSETIGKPTSTYDPVAAVWTLAFDGVAYPDWAYSDGHYRLSRTPALGVNFDASRDRSSWRSIPALIADPWTARSHISISFPAGDVAISGTEPRTLTVPGVEWKRAFSSSAGRLVEEIVSRETGEEIAPGQISGTGKSIDDETGRAAHIELPASYPMRWVDVPGKRSAPAVKKVRAVFDQRVAAAPEEAERFGDRAWFEQRLLDRAASEADYSRAIALDPTANRYLSRANLRAERGDHAGALADARAAYELEEGNEEVRDRLAAELAENGQLDKALELLPEAPDFTTDDGLTDYIQRINLLETGNQHDAAMQLLDAALEKRGSSAELRNTRCWFSALRNRDIEAALDDCNRAIELSSEPAGFLDSRGMVHFRAGRLEKAQADYEAALALSPDMASALFMYGLVLDRLGKKAEATASIQAARTEYPDIEHFYARFGIKR